MLTNLLDEMNQFLKEHDLSNLTQREIDNMNRTIYVKETKSLINNLQKQKAPGPDRFTSELY